MRLYLRSTGDPTQFTNFADYEPTARTLDSDGWICGRTTMQQRRVERAQSVRQRAAGIWHPGPARSSR